MPTFPPYPPGLPRCLDPWKIRHWLLVIYWVLFRPSALKCYLYQVDPGFYRNPRRKPGQWKSWFGRMRIRNLMLTALLGSLVIGTVWWNLNSVFPGPPLPEDVYPALNTLTSMALNALLVVTLVVPFGVGFIGSSVVAYGVARAVALIVAIVLGLLVVIIVWGTLFAGSMVRLVSGEFYSYYVMAFYLSNVVACLVALGVAYGVVYGVAEVVVLVVAFAAAFVVAPVLAMNLTNYFQNLQLKSGSFFAYAFNLRRIIFHLKFFGVPLGMTILLGSLRVPFYLFQGLVCLWIPWGATHPIWWDELAILPFLGIKQEIKRVWIGGEEAGLVRLAPLAGNPFQRWVLQRALVNQLNTSSAPIHFLYRLFRLEALQVYANPPLTPGEWEKFPSVCQVFLAELGGLGMQQAQGLQRLVLRLTQPLRSPTPAPLADLAGLMLVLNLQRASTGTGEVASQAIDLDRNPARLAALSSYPGGSEIVQSFTALATFQRAAALADLAAAERSLAGLPSAAEAIRPEVIEAIGRFVAIGRDVAVALAASSRLNQLAALGRASEALDGLGTFIESGVHLPEQSWLRRIQQHWLSLVSQGSGQLGHQVERSRRRVINPYVAGNPVLGSLFVGRDETMRWLEELCLNPESMDSVLLFGHRRMGKSSILKNLPDRLDSARNWVVQFNLQTVNRANTGSLLYDLALAMGDKLPRSQASAPNLPAEAAFQANFQRAFNQWLDALEPRLANHRFIVAIDEYELLEAAMAAGQVDPELIRYLRGVREIRSWLVFVLAGLHTLQEQCKDYWHPLFSNIRQRKVSFLSAAATKLLLTQPTDDFPLDYSPDCLAEIVRLTAGQPYLVQLIGQNLVGHFNRQVYEGQRDPDQPLDLPDLEAVIHSPSFFEDGHAYFSGVWAQADDAPPGQQAILRALAPGPANREALASRTDLAAAALGAALHTLEQHDVVRHGGEQGYGFTVELMRLWVLQRQAGGRNPAAGAAQAG